MKKINIGRSGDNDIVINNSKVSRRHAQIIVHDNGNVFIQDLNTTNGTFVNGMRIKDMQVLHPNDTVSMSNVSIPWLNFVDKQNSLPQRNMSANRLTVILGVSATCIMLFLFLILKKWDTNSTNDFFNNRPPVTRVKLRMDNSGNTLETFAYPGEIALFIKNNNSNHTKQIIEEAEGKVLFHESGTNYFHVKVPKNEENIFLEKISADLIYNAYSVQEEKLMGFNVFDNFSEDVHGSKVIIAYRSSGYCSDINTIDTPHGPRGINIDLVFSGFHEILKKGNEFTVINASFGVHTPNDVDFESLSDENKRIYHNSFKNEIKKIIEKLSVNENKNSIFVKSAGNNKYPLLYEAMTEVESELAARPKMLKVFKNSFLLVSDYNGYASTSDNYHSNVVFINHPDPGTSFAAPRAVCIIREIADNIEQELKRNPTNTEIMGIIQNVTSRNANYQLTRERAMKYCSEYIQSQKVHTLDVKTIANSGLQIEVGDRVEINASGTITFGPFAGAAGPEGIDDLWLESYNYFEDSGRHGALFVRVGDNKYFRVGNSLQFTSPYQGALFFLVNDEDYGNNTGFFHVKVKITK